MAGARCRLTSRDHSDGVVRAAGFEPATFGFANRGPPARLPSPREPRGGRRPRFGRGWAVIEGLLNYWCRRGTRTPTPLRALDPESSPGRPRSARIGVNRTRNLHVFASPRPRPESPLMPVRPGSIA